MESIDYKEVGKRLKELIFETGMNQTEFANLCQVNEGTLRLHIRGDLKKGINCDCLYAYSKALNVSMEYILTGQNQIIIKQEKNTAKSVINAFNFVLKSFGDNAILTPIDYDSYLQISRNQLSNKKLDDIEGSDIWLGEEDDPHIMGIIFNDKYVTKYLESRLKISTVSNELKNILGEKKYNETLNDLINIEDLYFLDGNFSELPF